MDFICYEVFPRKSPDNKNRTLNRHRWVGRVDSGAWENYVEGTRQNDLVTSGEGVLISEKSLVSDTKSGGATV